MLLHGERSLDLSVLDMDIESGTYGPGSYSSANKKDRINFDWGNCQIAYNPNRTNLSCSLNKPRIYYFIDFIDQYKICCASAESGNIGKKICQAQFPNATGTASTDYCGAGATIYKGY